MARTRQLQDLITDALRLVDVENAITRFPVVAGGEACEYVNKGLAKVYREIIICSDRPFYVTETNVQVQSPPLSGGGTIVPLPFDFMQILGLSWASNQSGPWQTMRAYEGESERAALLGSGYLGSGWRQFCYGFAGSPAGVTVGTIPTAQSLDIVPGPPLSSYVKVRYVPTCPRLYNLSDTFDGVLGFEDAACTWAAILMRRKDDLETAALEADFARHVELIHSVARRRDRSGPPRTQIVRNWGGGGRRQGRW